MIIRRDQDKSAVELNKIDQGQTFILPDTDVPFIKTDEFVRGEWRVVNLRTGFISAMSAERLVNPVQFDAVLAQ